MSMFSRMASNAGWGKIKGIAGQALRGDILGLQRMGRFQQRAMGRAMAGKGVDWRGMGSYMKGHFAGRGYTGPGGRAAAVGVRGLHQAAGLGAMYATADFFNPWGLGWGD